MHVQGLVGIIGSSSSPQHVLLVDTGDTQVMMASLLRSPCKTTVNCDSNCDLLVSSYHFQILKKSGHNILQPGIQVYVFWWWLHHVRSLNKLWV